MGCLDGFNTNVQYIPSQVDNRNNVFAWAETAADVCRTPGRWLASTLWDGGRKVTVAKDDGIIEGDNKEAKLGCVMKTIRTLVGLVLFIPGEIMGAKLMAFAFLSEEIRLKHKMAVTPLTQEQKERLQQLVNERQVLASEKKECDPISCVLCTMLCLLCVIASKL